MITTNTFSTVEQHEPKNCDDTQISGVEAGIAMYVTDDILLEANVAYVDGLTLRKPCVVL